MAQNNNPITGDSPLTLAQSSTNMGALFPTLSRSETGGPGADGVYFSAEQNNRNARGIRLFTVVADGSGTVVIQVQVKNPYTDAWVNLAGAATAALDNTSVLTTIYPGLTGIADSTGVTINQHLGTTWRLSATVATAAEVFSVGVDYLL